MNDTLSRKAAGTMAFFLVPAALLALAPPRGASAAASSDAAGAAWPEIPAAELALKRVDADPEADAVVLYQERNGRILQKGDDTVNVIDEYRRIKILTEAGKRYGEVHIPGDKYSRVSNLRARTIRPDGSIVPIAADQIFEKVVLQVGDQKWTEIVFNFPAVEPGAILEHRYDRNDNRVYYIAPWFFAGPEFTLRSRVTQAVPGDMGYMILCDLCSGATPTLTPWREAKSKGTLYTVELRDVPGYRDELLMPPARDVAPRMEMVLQARRNYYWAALGRQDKLYTDWPSIAKFIDYYYRQAVNDGLSKIKPVAESWAAGAADPQAKIAAVLRHVRRDFRYLDWDSIVGFARPIETMLKDKIADNEDKAVLLASALKALGIESRIALVSGRHRGGLNPKFFSPSQFTHAVVGVSRPDGTVQWFDPTVTYAASSFMPWRDSGADALILDGGAGEIIALPARSEPSAAKYKVLVTPRPDGRAAVAVEAEFTGEDAIDLRDALVPVAETARKGWMQSWLAARVSGAALQEHAFENLDDPEKPLKARLTFEAPGLVTLADEAMLVRGCILSCESANPLSRGTRRYPFYVEKGWSEDETVTVKAAAGMKPSPVPPPVMAKSSVGSLTFSCMAQGDESVRCMRLFNARRNRWPASENDSIRAMFDKVVEADRTMVAFEPAEAAGASSGR